MYFSINWFLFASSLEYISDIIRIDSIDGNRQILLRQIGIATLQNYENLQNMIDFVEISAIVKMWSRGLHWRWSASEYACYSATCVIYNPQKLCLGGFV
jgi:hypothetical protein